MPPVTIVGLGGSLVQPSRSLAALKAALEGAAADGATIQLLDVRELDLPMYRPGMDPAPAVQQFCDTVYGANGMIWSSPLYNGTISGAFKNCLDWLQLLSDRDPSYLTDKVVGLISTAGGMHGLQAINTMEFVVRALRGWAVPLVVPIGQAWKVIDDDGEILDERTEQLLLSLGQEVAHAAQHFAVPLNTPSAVALAEEQEEPISPQEAKL